LPIGSNLPEISRVIREYQVGEVTDPENPTSIAQAIHSILSDPIQLAQMKANTSKAVKDFNWQNESKKLLDVYSTLSHG
jgi:glycosyltransferase involved in cell wall biosynthesis